MTSLSVGKGVKPIKIIVKSLKFMPSTHLPKQSSGPDENIWRTDSGPHAFCLTPLCIVTVFAHNQIQMTMQKMSNFLS